MSEPQDPFSAALASEAVEVREDHLLFPGDICCPYPRAGAACQA